MTGNNTALVMLASTLLAAAGFGCGGTSDAGNDQSTTGTQHGAAGNVGGDGQNPSTTGGDQGQATSGPGNGQSSPGSAPGQISGGGGTGQVAGAAGGDGSGSGNAMVDTACTITPTLTMSTAISTVGIVEFTTDLDNVDAAYIEFGLDQMYGMKAPVDLNEPNYRTVLLGMKPDHQYHYRVVVMSGDTRCTGSDNMLQTGSIPNQLGLLKVQVDTPQPDKVTKGFMLMGYMRNGPTFIVDQDGDYVWWFDSGDITRARMSYDGKYVWTQSLNWSAGIGPVAAGQNPGGHPVVHRVSVDGMDVQTYGLDQFGDPTHDFDVTPDGSYIMPAFNSATGCMKVVERTADGQLHDIINSEDVNPGDQCLINSIHYWPDDDTITYSDLGHNAYVKITRSGQVLWVLGGPNSTFTQGDGIKWFGEHGHHMLAPDRLLMFNNGINPMTGERDSGTTSTVYEVMLDQSTNTATRVWQYAGGLQTNVFGDAQRLPNGNTVVNYGIRGTIHEVDPDGNLVQSMSWDLGGVIAYIDWRSSLYGPPDR